MRESVHGPSTENLQRAVAPHLGRVYRLPQIGFCSVYRLPSLPEHRGRSHYMSYFRSEPAYSHAHGHRATFVSVSMAPSRSLQDPEARSDLGPTGILGPRTGGASVTTSLGQASVRGSTEPRWRFGEIKNGWIWYNLAHTWWLGSCLLSLE